MTPLRKDEVPVYRGHERHPIISIDSPAYGRLLLRACGLIENCCLARNLETKQPGALKIHRTGLAGYLVAEPVVQFDPYTPDLYELKWQPDRKLAGIDLLPMLQPRNMEVAAGYVSEIPLSLEDLGGKSCLVFHLQEAETRPIQQMTEEQKTAMAQTRQTRKVRTTRRKPDLTAPEPGAAADAAAAPERSE